MVKKQDSTFSKIWCYIFSHLTWLKNEILLRLEPRVQNTTTSKISTAHRTLLIPSLVHYAGVILTISSPFNEIE